MILNLGYVGENEHRQIRFDAKKMYDEYPHASASLTVAPAEGESYPAVIERDGDFVIWTITDSDLNAEGDGELQLSFTYGETVAKSYIGRFKVSRSIVPTGEIPEGIDDFLTRAGAALTAIPETIDEALAEAKASGEFDGADGQDGQDGADGFSPIATVTKSGNKATISITDANGTTTAEVTDGADGAPGQDGAPGIDGFSPRATVSKSGSTATITITDAAGTTTAQISDGEGADIIDDTAGSGDTDKVWSADKSSSLLTEINSRPETSPTTETAVDLDVTDPDGNVLVRMKDGQIETKNFDSSLVSDTRPSTAENTDLDITDADGNVLLRLQSGNIKTKYFDSTDTFRVPDYYHANGYLKGKCDRVNALARGCAKKSDTFAFVTDLHWHLNAGKSPALLRYIKENTRIEKFFCGGDVCDFITSEHQPYDAWTTFQDALKMPIYVAMGNHDYMASYGTEGRLYYTFNSVGRDRIGDFNRNYFYVDNPQAQIRYVFLNGFQPNGSGSWTWGLEQDQIDWMNNTALDLETGWGAIIVTHMIIGIDLDYTPYQIYKPTMATNLLNELDSYNGNGEIIAVICGHTHFDYLDYSTGGIPIIVTTSDKYLPWIQSEVDKEPWLSDRVEGTITEQAIDLFVVDREAKTITRVRVGCPIHYGTDPETWTEHEEVTVSYDRS